MSWLIALPVLIPLAAALASLAAWRHRLVQRVVALGATVALVAASVALAVVVWRQGIQATQIGNWPAPFGITLVGDGLSTAMLVVASLIGLCGALYAVGSIDAQREAHGYHVFFLLLLLGVNGAFLTGDLFNLYVWFEVMLIASFVLLVLGNRPRQVRGAVTYVVINVTGSALLLTSVALVYGTAGTLNFADLTTRLPLAGPPELRTTLALMFMVAFGIKAALFPLFFWLPDSYHTPPIAVSAVFAGLLTKVGVYALIRTFTMLFTHDVAVTHGLLLVIAGFTMVTGVLGALAQSDLRRLLSFHIVSQIGYMVMGLALLSRLALAGAVFFVIHNIVAKTSLFFFAGLARRNHSFDLGQMGGLYRDRPGLAFLFALPALALAGVPPLSGFWGKLILARAGLEQEQWVIVAVAIVVSLLTLLSMTKIWTEAIWKPPPPDTVDLRPRGWLGVAVLAPVVGLALGTVAIGIFADGLFAVTSRAAEQLLDKADYVAAVRGGTR